MSDIYLFIWGTIAFLFAVGPLSAAWYLDYLAQQHAREMEDAAGLRNDDAGLRTDDAGLRSDDAK